MITVRSIIAEALNRSNLVSRRQSAPADMVETGLKLLQGIAAKYSNDDLLQFLVESAEGDHDKEDHIVGETDASAEPGTYKTVDIEAKDVGRISAVYVSMEGSDNVIPCQFASAKDYDVFPKDSAIYTWQPINDLQVKLSVKVNPDDRYKVKVVYNKRWNIHLDDDLFIPDQYSELFITALTHKFALTFPRLNTEQVNLLKADLDAMEANLKTSTRAIKYVSRKPNRRYQRMSDFISGRYLM